MVAALEGSGQGSVAQRVAEVISTNGVGAIADTVVFFDSHAEQQLRLEALAGAFGEQIKAQVLVRGPRATFTRFAGFTVVWGHPHFVIKRINELNQDELRLVVWAQQQAMSALAENQRRF